jgi:hypothetical protein
MLKNNRGEKLTPNQIAKEIIYDALESIFYDIEDKWALLNSKPTEKEFEEIGRHLEKHRIAIVKKLGLL